MKNVKNIVFRLLRKLIFSLFLISLLFAVYAKKLQAQIVGLEKDSKAQLIKKLEEQVDQQKTQLDTMKTNLESLQTQISKDEESTKTIDEQKYFRNKMANGKEEIKGFMVEFLAQQPEFSSDKEIVDKFYAAKKAMEKYEQDFISKIEVKPAEQVSSPTEVTAPIKAKKVVKKIQKAVEPAATEPTSQEPIEQKPNESQPEEQIPALISAETTQAAESNKVEEAKPEEISPMTSPEVQTISKEIPQMPMPQPTAEMPEQGAENVAKTPEIQPAMIPTQNEPVTLPAEKAQ